MSILLIICSILGAIGIVLVILESVVQTKSSWLFGIGMILLSSTSIIGFLFLACGTTKSHKIEQIPIDTIVKSPTVLYVEFVNGERLEYTNKKEYDEINMDTKIYKVTYLNHYNSKLNTEYLLDTTNIK